MCGFILITLLVSFLKAGSDTVANQPQPTAADELSVDQLYDSAIQYYGDGDFSKTTLYAEMALKKADRAGDYAQQARSYLLIARIKYIQGDDSLALALRKRALSIAEKK